MADIRTMGVPGLDGFLMSQANRRAEQQQQLQAMQGALGLQGLLMQQQMMPLQMQKMQEEVAASKAKRDMLGQIQGVFGQGGLSAGSTAAPLDAQLDLIGRVAAADPQRGRALLEWWKAKNPEVKWQGGIPLHPRSGQPLTGAPMLPQTNQQGFSTTPKFDPQTGQFGVGVTPGSAEAFGLQQSIQQGTAAQFDLVDVPDGRGGTIKMPRAQAAQILGGQQPASPPAPTAQAAPVRGTAGTEQEARNLVAEATRRGQPMSVTVAPQGRGPVSTEAVLGRNPSQAEQAADKETQVGLAKRGLDLPEATSRVSGVVDSMNRLKTTAQELLDDPNLQFAVGIATPLSYAPGTPAAATRAKIETLKSQIGLSVLQALREASKTGGALGQVSNFENVMMQQNLAPLSRATRPEDFRKSLQKIVDYADGATGRVTGAYETMFETKFQKPEAPKQSGPKTIKFGDLP